MTWTAAVAVCPGLRETSSYYDIITLHRECGLMVPWSIQCSGAAAADGVLRAISGPLQVRCRGGGVMTGQSGPLSLITPRTQSQSSSCHLVTSEGQSLYEPQPRLESM